MIMKAGEGNGLGEKGDEELEEQQKKKKQKSERAEARKGRKAAKKAAKETGSSSAGVKSSLKTGRFDRQGGALAVKPIQLFST